MNSRTTVIVIPPVIVILVAGWEFVMSSQGSVIDEIVGALLIIWGIAILFVSMIFGLRQLRGKRDTNPGEAEEANTP